MVKVTAVEAASMWRRFQRRKLSPAGTVVIGLGILTVGYLLWVSAGGARSEHAGLISDVVTLPFGLAAGFLALATAVRLRSSRRRFFAWLLLAVAFLVFWLGDVLWFRYDTILKIAPFPSWADAGYLAYYPLLLGGLLLLSRRASDWVGRTKSALDAATVVLAGAMFVWFFMLLPTLQDGGRGLELATSVGYPIGDLLLILGIGTIALRVVALESRPVLLALLTGVLLAFAADAIFGYRNVRGSYQNGGWEDGFYLLSWFFVALAARLEFRAAGRRSAASAQSEPALGPSLRARHLPFLATPPAVFVVLLLSLRHQLGTAQAQLALGVVLLIVLVLVRQVMAMRESARLREEKAARESAERFESLVKNASDVVTVTTPDGTITYQTPSVGSLLGFEPAELAGTRLLDLVHPDDASEVASTMAELASQSGASQRREWRMRHRDGSWRPTETVLSNLLDDPRVCGLVLTSRDISERKRAEEELAKSEAHFRALIENSSDLIAVTDPDGIIRFHSSSCLRTLGFRPEELEGQNAIDLIHPEDRAIAGGTLTRLGERGASESAELRFRHKDGSWRVLEVMGSRLDGPSGEPLTVLNSRDITEHKLWEEALRHQALHDSITGLPNRACLRDRLQALTRPGRRKARPFALCILDLDAFKEINDTFGHHSGDALLRQLAYRLQKNLRSADMVARLGGDEFAVIVSVDTAAEASRVAMRILDILQPLYEVEGQKLGLSASVGVALFPLHGSDAEGLLRFADVAMYAAKHGGGARHAIYDIRRDPHSRDRIAIHSELRAGFERDELSLYYQPLVESARGRIVALEALARWHHPRRGLVLPCDFIEAVEHDGIGRSFVAWALRSAIEQCAVWRLGGLEVGVAVNLSARDLDDPELPELVSGLLMEYGTEPADLTVELTESSIMLDPRRSIGTLTALRGLGVKVAVDDFGSGQSTLTYLRELPLDQVKIDKSFVLNMAVERQDAAIVRSTIGLGHELGLAVVAEGVEDHATEELLRAFGCDIVQGYHLGRPMPAESVALHVSAADAAVVTKFSRNPMVLAKPAGGRARSLPVR